MKKCQKCGTLANDGTKFCGNCGAVLGTFCPHCGKENQGGAKFCSYCGENMEDHSLSNQTFTGTQNPPPRYGWTNNTSGLSGQTVYENSQGPTDSAAAEQPVEEKVNMLTAYTKFATFSGRSTRKEYWLFFLFQFLVIFLINLLIGGFGENVEAASALIGMFGLINIIPGLSASIRRLHDIGKSGWWLLFSFVPLIGQITLFIFYCTASEPKSNEYGPYTIAK